MSEVVVVAFGKAEGKDVLRRTILDMGGAVVPGSIGDVQLSDGDATVWVMFDSEDPPGFLSQEDADRYANLLGRPHAGESVLIMSRSGSSKQLVLRIVAELAGRTPIVVNDDHGWITGVDDLLTFGAANPDGLFSGPPGGPGAEHVR